MVVRGLRSPPGCRPSDVEELRAAGLTAYPASVPGNLELDLLANGLIDEPFQGMNIVGLRRYEHAYAPTTCGRFEAASTRDESHTWSFCEGIDCFATPAQRPARPPQRQHADPESACPWRACSRPGEAGTPCAWCWSRPSRGPGRPRSPYPPGRSTPSAAATRASTVRKAPHMFRLGTHAPAVSAGLWRPVTLRYPPRRAARLGMAGHREPRRRSRHGPPLASLPGDRRG